MVGALILIGLLALAFLLCIAPAWLAMVVSMQLLMERYMRARASRTSRVGLNLLVIGIGLTTGLITYLTEGVAILGAPVLGIIALVLARRNARRDRTWPELPVARAL